MRLYRFADVEKSPTGSLPVMVAGAEKFWALPALLGPQELHLRQGDRTVASHSFPGIPKISLVTAMKSHGKFVEIVEAAQRSALFDAENNIVPLPGDPVLERTTPINPLVPFVQKIAERLPPQASLQILTPTQANLIERTNIFDDLAFSQERPEQALRFYASLSALQAEAVRDTQQLRVAPFAFAVLENEGKGKARSPFLITARREGGDGQADAISPERLLDHRTRAYLSLLSIDDERGAFHYVITGLWYEKGESYGVGEDAVRYALGLLISTIMERDDMLYDPQNCLGTHGLVHHFAPHLLQSVDETTQLIWSRKSGQLFAPGSPVLGVTVVVEKPPRSPVMRPTFRPDELAPSVPLVSLSTRSLETAIEVNETKIAEIRATHYPLPILFPGRTIDDLFKDYIAALPAKGRGQDKGTLRTNFNEQWLRSKQGQEQLKRSVIKRMQRKRVVPPEPLREPII